MCCVLLLIALASLHVRKETTIQLEPLKSRSFANSATARPDIPYMFIALSVFHIQGNFQKRNLLHTSGADVNIFPKNIKTTSKF